MYYHNSATLFTRSIEENLGPAQALLHREVLLTPPVVDNLKKTLRAERDIAIFSLLSMLSCVSVRRDVCQKCLNYLPRLIDGTDFFFFYVSVSMKQNMLFDPIILTKYRIHQSTSNIFNPSSIGEMSRNTI